MLLLPYYTYISSIRYNTTYLFLFYSILTNAIIAVLMYFYILFRLNRSLNTATLVLRYRFRRSIASSDLRSLVRVALYALATIYRHASCYIRNALASPFTLFLAYIT